MTVYACLSNLLGRTALPLGVPPAKIQFVGFEELVRCIYLYDD